MDDPAYKQLFSRPRMVEDLLHGFAARDWSRSLDFASLAPLPASHVSHDLRQRHGDLLLREQGDEELTQAFRSWVAQVLLPRRFRGGESESLPRLEEVRTMLAEQVREWTEEWVEEGREQGIAQGREQGIAQGREQGIAQGREQGIAQGREQGIAQGRAEERALLCRQAERKFDAATARRLAAALEDVADPGRLAEIGDWIIECGTAADLLARVSDERRRGV
jgi:flagellar biosynthesis/type III secretory pathway protein FliH